MVADFYKKLSAFSSKAWTKLHICKQSFFPKPNDNMWKTCNMTRCPVQTWFLQSCYKPSSNALPNHVLLPLSNHLIFTYFLWAPLLFLWISKHSVSPSQRIVCLNWKVSRGKLTYVANHFKTTFHLFPSFFFISLSIIFIYHAAGEGPFIWKGKGRNSKKKCHWTCASLPIGSDHTTNLHPHSLRSASSLLL